MTAARSPRSVGPVGLIAATNVRRLRKARGLTAEQLIEKLRASGRPWWPIALTRVEAGVRHLDADDLACLAEALDVTVQQLLEPPACENCGDAPAARFTCNVCGAEGPA